MKIKKGDTVIMTKGKDKNKKNKVAKAFPKENKIIVDGLNLVKKHSKPKKQGEKGQIISIPRAVQVCNVKLICLKCNQPTKVGYTIIENKKHRICKKCKATID